MAQKLTGLSLVSREALPVPCAACRFWEHPEPLERRCGVVCDPEAASEWARVVTAEWGEYGRAVTDEDGVVGFIRYAPPAYFAQAGHLPAGPPLPDAVMISCLHIEPQARGGGVGGLLLRAALRDLAARGERTVQAYADATRAPLDDNPLIGVAFLLRHGFTVERPHPETPLLKLDLKSLVSWADSLESMLDSLRVPLRVPRSRPATLSVEPGDV